MASSGLWVLNSFNLKISMVYLFVWPSIVDVQLNVKDFCNLTQ